MPAVAIPPNSQTLAPLPGESQVTFFVRANRQLAASFPKQAGRSIHILKLWRKSDNCEELQEAAAEQFPDAEYEHVGPVPVWSEHTFSGADGEQTKYDLHSLQAIVERCNERILDTGDFSPITDGHTPDEEQKLAGVKQPDVLGFAGPFYVGLIGNKKPRWAIFADEHWQKEDVARLKRLPRRSPEIWLEDRMEDRFLDPIAALGAETPRLDSGISRNHRTSDGRLVAKYSAAAFPAGGNTFIPTSNDKSRNAAGERQMLNPDDVKQIVAAIMQTEPMQWVQSQMRTSTNEPDLDDPTPEAGAAPGGGDTHVDDTADFDDDERQQYAAMSDAEKCAYMKGRRKSRNAAGGDVPAMPPAGTPSTQHYSRTGGGGNDVARYRRENQELRQQNQALNQRVSRIEQQRTEQDRYSRLESLSREFIFEVDEELAETKELTDPQFDKHCNRIVVKYSRRPTERDSQPFYAPDIPVARGKQQDVMKYHRMARERMDTKGITFKEAATQIKAENKLDFDIE